MTCGTSPCLASWVVFFFCVSCFCSLPLLNLSSLGRALLGDCTYSWLRTFLCDNPILFSMPPGRWSGCITRPTIGDAGPPRSQRPPFSHQPPPCPSPYTLVARTPESIVDTFVSVDLTPAIRRTTTTAPPRRHRAGVAPHG